MEFWNTRYKWSNYNNSSSEYPSFDKSTIESYSSIHIKQFIKLLLYNNISNVNNWLERKNNSLFSRIFYSCRVIKLLQSSRSDGLEKMFSHPTDINNFEAGRPGWLTPFSSQYPGAQEEKKILLVKKCWRRSQ